MSRKQLFNILKIIVSLSLLIYIFNTIDLPGFGRTLAQADGRWLAAAIGVMIVSVVLRAIRWQILLHDIGVAVSTGELTVIYFIGALFNNLLPSGVGGDAIRMLELNRHTQRGSDTVTSVVVERFIGLSGQHAIALVSLLTNWGTVPDGVAYFAILVFIAELVAGYLLINRSLYLSLRRRIWLFRYATDIKIVGNLFESFQRYSLPALGRSYLVSFLFFNVSLIAMHACIGAALHAPITIIQFAIIVPIVSLVLILPISFAGLGVREEAYRQLYGQIGVSPEVAIAMSLIVYLVGNVFAGLIGGVLYLLRSARSVVTNER